MDVVDLTGASGRATGSGGFPALLSSPATLATSWSPGGDPMASR